MTKREEIAREIVASPAWEADITDADAETLILLISGAIRDGEKRGMLRVVETVRRHDIYNEGVQPLLDQIRAEAEKETK